MLPGVAETCACSRSRIARFLVHCSYHQDTIQLLHSTSLESFLWNNQLFFTLDPLYLPYLREERNLLKPIYILTFSDLQMEAYEWETVSPVFCNWLFHLMTQEYQPSPFVLHVTTIISCRVLIRDENGGYQIPSETTGAVKMFNKNLHSHSFSNNLSSFRSSS